MCKWRESRGSHSILLSTPESTGSMQPSSRHEGSPHQNPAVFVSCLRCQPLELRENKFLLCKFHRLSYFAVEARADYDTRQANFSRTAKRVNTELSSQSTHSVSAGPTCSMGLGSHAPVRLFSICLNGTPFLQLLAYTVK